MISADRALRFAHAATLVVIACITMVSSMAAQERPLAEEGPKPGAVGEPVAPMEIKRIYDMADLLNDEQVASLERDAARLRRFDLPVIIIVQFNELSAEAAQTFAVEIRRAWGVESEAGADDGMVMLVSVNTSEGGISTVLSWGEDALPNYGVDDVVAASIKEEWLDRHIADGQLFEGILFSLRRFLYHSIYSPAPQEPLTTSQRLTGTGISVAGPIIALGSIVLAGWWHVKRSVDGTAARFMLLGVPAMSLGIAVVSIWARSGWGISAALVLLVLTAALWVERDPARGLPSRDNDPLGTTGTP